MTIYTVKQGDTLYSIGKRYGVTIEQLINANGQTVQPSLIIGQAVIIPTSTDSKPNKLINGYAYPFIQNEALNSTLDYLSLITPFSYGVTQNGTLLDLDDQNLIDTALARGVKPLLLVTSLTEQGSFSSERAAEVLSDTALGDALISSITQKLKTQSYYGVDIDFEYIPQQYGAEYAEFIARLKAAVGEDYKVFVSVAPKTSAMQRGLLYEAHNYKALGAAADYILVMTYEWGYTYGPPMAVAPINKVREVLEYAVTEIPPQKLLMGIPNYAYDWTLPFEKGDAARSLSNNSAVELARTRGAEIMFDQISQTPYFNYYDDNANRHVVWFEDARSINAKAELLKELNLAGASVWNVMNFYKPLYTVLSENFNITKL